MQLKYKLVLFDLDGTLIDSLEDLAAAVNYALSLRGYPLHGLDEYRKMVGHGVRNLVTQALPEALRADEGLIDAALADFKAYYSSHIDVHTRPYPGIPKLLEDLDASGARIAVASNKFQAGTEKLVKEFFPEIPFAAILGNREGFPLKPDPEIVGEALRSSGISREEAVLVGDSGTDMLTARNGGIDAIAVGWGYRQMSAAEGHRFAGSVQQLRTILSGDFESHPFEPFLPSGARMLFLGSFPPQQHRWCMPFYYPNWINDFWRILGLIHFGDKNHFCIPGEKRFDEALIREFCTARGLAFYDTACEVRRLRDNASDAFLEVVTPTDIPALLQRIPQCRMIITTGEKASGVIAERFGCHVPEIGGCVEIEGGMQFWRMPSSSRAYPLPLEKKAEYYRRLFQ